MRKLQRNGAAPALALLCVLGAATAATAATATAGEAPQPKKVQVEVPAVGAGLTAAIDPVTGKLRPPTPAELQALSDQMKKTFRATAEVTVIEYPDGTVSVDLGDAFMNMSIVRINPDGSKSATCVESVDAATQFFAAAATPAFEER